MIRRLWRALYRHAVIARFSEEERIVRFFRAAGVRPGSRVLDVGCGEGRMLHVLRDRLGSTPVGVEINGETAARVRAQGFECYAPGDPALAGVTWDGVLMAHVIEHLAYEPLLAFFDVYLGDLGRGGSFVVATPLLQPRFWDDADHVRPYPPAAVRQMLGRPGQQVQRQAAVELEEVAVWYRRAPFEPRSELLARSLRLLCYMTGGLIGRTTGWVGLYRRAA